MSLHVKDKKELKKWKDKSTEQEVAGTFGTDLADTFKGIRKDVDRLKKRVSNLEKAGANQSQKAYAKALECERMLASVMERLK